MVPFRDRIQFISKMQKLIDIIAEGKEYISQSTMSEAVDLLGFEQDSFLIAGELSYTLLSVFIDLPGLGNRYLFRYTVNDRSKANFQEFSDNVNNGLSNQRPVLHPNVLMRSFTFFIQRCFSFLVAVVLMA